MASGAAPRYHPANLAIRCSRMADHIRYDLLTQQALRGVVRSVLTEAAKKGLPGDHHFYISFDTKRRGRAHVRPAARAVSGAR